MLKKMTVLAMALGVVAAMLVPATASAAWKHHATTIQQNVQIGLTGQIATISEAGGISCQVTIRAKFIANQTTGEAETFAPHPTNATTNCTTSGGLSQCEVEQVQPTNLPWTFHTTGTAANPTIQLTVGDIHMELKKKNFFCLFTHITKTAGTATLTPTPGNGNTVTALTLSGNTQGHLYSNTPEPVGQTVGLTFGGTLNIESPNSGTYSL
jgi:hypothetical protein